MPSESNNTRPTWTIESHIIHGYKEHHRRLDDLALSRPDLYEKACDAIDAVYAKACLDAGRPRRETL